MTNQNSNLTPLNSRQLELSRVLNVLALIAFVFALSIAYGVSGEAVNNYKFLSTFADAMGSIVPSVRNVAAGTRHPDIARLVLASQWIFFPFYLGLMVLAQPPWENIRKSKMTARFAQRRKQGKSREDLVVLIFGICAMLLFFLSDMGFIDNFPSFYKGNIFSDPGVRHSALLASQREFTFGLVLASWFSPIAETLLCFLFLHICNAPLCFFQASTSIPESGK